METSIPFGPVNKRQVVAIKPSHTAEYVRIVIKGAPEYVMPFCRTQFNERGEEVELSLEERDRILESEIIGKCARKGLRTIVYGYKDVQAFDWDFMKKHNNHFLTERDREIIEKDFCFVAGFGLNDDLREGVVEAIKKLNDG